jgi:hypothetical protein
MTCIFSAGGGLTMRQDQDPGTVEGPEFTSTMAIFSRFYVARSLLSGQSFSGMSTYRGQQAPQAASKPPMVISTRDLRHLRNAANKEQGSVAFPMHRFFSSSFIDPQVPRAWAPRAIRCTFGGKLWVVVPLATPSSATWWADSALILKECRKLRCAIVRIVSEVTQLDTELALFNGSQ